MVSNAVFLLYGRPPPWVSQELDFAAQIRRPYSGGGLFPSPPLPPHHEADDMNTYPSMCTMEEGSQQRERTSRFDMT